MNQFYNADCMNPVNGLPRYPDNYFDWAIVDPQYGINISNKLKRAAAKGKKYGAAKVQKKLYETGSSDWDKQRPDKKYFDELQRVSKNQIIFGWNYFSDLLPQSQGFIVWYKKTNGAFSDCELAYCSVQRPAIVLNFKWNGFQQGDMKNKEIRIHETQKPVKLYQEIMTRFCSQGQLILDSHVGSASSLIAAASMGLNYIGYEIDPVKFQKAKNRLSKGIPKRLNI